jgi:hypothetical protein
MLLATSMAACGGGTGDKTAATRLPSPGHRTTTGATGTAKHRRAARCHLVSAHAFAAGVDRSKPVPCSRRHNLETIGTHPVFGKVDRSVLRQYGTDCGLDATNRLHLQGPEVVRVDVEPIDEPASGGHSIIRCDASLISGIGQYFGLPREITTTSLRDVTRHGHGPFVRWCTDAPPGPAGSRFVDCRRPHLAEVIGGWATIDATHGFPARAVATQGQRICRRRTARLSDAGQLRAYGWWWSKDIWVEQGRPPQVAGVCWQYRRDGQDLPALQ